MGLNLIERKRGSGKKLIIVYFFLALALAGIDTVWSLYFKSFGLSDSTIGLISGILVFFSITASFLCTPILEKFKLTKLISFAIIIAILSYILIGLIHNLYLFLILGAILYFVAVIRVSSFSILFRDNNPGKEYNQVEGILFSIINIGWLIGPIIAGFFLVEFGISSVFFISSLLFFIAFVFFYIIHAKNIPKKRKKIDGNLKENFLRFIKTKKIRLPYILTLGIGFWWGFIYIYMPLFIIEQGLKESIIGIFFAITVFPLVVLEFKIGKDSIKYGFKKFFIIGFFGLSVMSFLAFIFNEINLQIIFLSVASVFAALIEPLFDVYFFKQVKAEEEEKFFPFFNTSYNFGNILSKLLIALILLMLPYNYSFLVMSIIMALFAITSFLVNKNSN